MAKKPSKTSYFLFLVYPESAPDDWVGMLRRSHCAFAISPLHQPDEEHDKPHYHVIFHSDGPINLSNAYEKIPNEVPANGYVEPAGSSSGSMRYLIHLDDPEKEQFPGGANAIQLLNGFPLDLTRELSKAEKAKIRAAIFEIIRENGVTEYADLIFGLIDYGDPDMLDYACNHTILFNNVISSLRHSRRVE